MRIGTVRTEEAKVYDSHAGYHRFHTDNIYEYGPQESYGSFEVFWHDDKSVSNQETYHDMVAGWYWAAGFPGCMYDSAPTGPFAYSQQAHEDADEWAPEYWVNLLNAE
jgi:hypothetical protein|tara:strand:+ start:196 stop:519 length:324 start_codon:yes stop_codon:yes gene_type:complete